MQQRDKCDVSIIIVCMNNLTNLFPCLNSIKANTNVEYETIVVAYLFSETNLRLAKEEYPWVKFIESNEIRGFSENNNLAIRIAKGEFCFILNDDTIFPMPVVDELLKSFKLLPFNAVCISPSTYFINNKIQSCGRPKHTILTYVFSLLGLWKEQVFPSKYTNKKGIFRTYDIVGAAFLFKTDILRRLGMFDERFFFCPEDIALSSKANKCGYSIFVDSNVKLFHIENGTASLVKSATAPSATRGELLFYSNGNIILYHMLGCIVYLRSLIKCSFSLFLYQINHNKENYINYKMYKNILIYTFSKKTPKEIFINIYRKIK